MQTLLNYIDICNWNQIDTVKFISRAKHLAMRLLKNTEWIDVVNLMKKKLYSYIDLLTLLYTYPELQLNEYFLPKRIIVVIVINFA